MEFFFADDSTQKASRKGMGEVVPVYWTGRGQK